MADCPYCLQPGATRILWRVRCPNPMCPKYDERLAGRPMSGAARPDTLRVRMGPSRPELPEEDELEIVRREPSVGGEDESPTADEAPVPEARPRSPVPTAPPAAPVSGWRRLAGVLLLAGGVWVIFGMPSGDGEKGQHVRWGGLMIFFGWSLMRGGSRTRGS